MNRQLAVRSLYDNITEHDAVDAPAMTSINQASRNTPLLDSQLIVQIGQSDQQALGALYDQYGALVYTIALRITHDQALAETVVLDVFYTTWQTARSFQIGASVPLWLIEMAQHQSVEALGQQTHTGC